MKIYLILLILSSCSYFKREPVLSESSKSEPAWLYSPYDACDEATELCATGEGKTYSDSDAQAKVNLASIFEVKVKSDFNSFSSASSNFPWQGQVREEVQSSINQSVDQILETVQIKKHFKKDGLSFALASLDRNKAAQLLGERISKLDLELEALWANRQRTNLRKIVRLNLERERLNERYSIVAGGPKPSVVTYQQIIRWRESKPLVEDLSLKIGQAPDWLKEKLKELLTEAGFKLIKGETQKSLALNVDAIKEYLNVEGFEKYTFTLNMTSFERGEKKKVISISETVTGRSQSDALLKVKPIFTEYIEQHLSDLKLD
ncbi:MAG: LPP20 family lipoprotein [Bacteriovoracaceae bacterium]